MSLTRSRGLGSLVLGSVLGAAVGLEAARRAAVQPGGVLADALDVHYVVTGAVGGGIIGIMLLWLRPLRRRGQWMFVLAWGIACVAGATVIALPDLLRQWNWLDLAFAVGLGGASGLVLGMYVHEILRRGNPRDS